MRLIARALITALIFAPLLPAAPPAPLIAALEYLRDQKSYSWESINGDPGPVAQEFETRRGTYLNVQRNMAPNIKGKLDRNGDLLLQREWSDGVKLDTIILKDGTTLTKTPDGWMTERDILTAQANESVSPTSPERLVWLRRADRPDIRRPDQELQPFLKGVIDFTESGSSYTASVRMNSSGILANSEDSPPFTTITVTLNLSGGNIRDYEIKVEGFRRDGRSRVTIPVSDQRIVIVTYVPVNRIDITAEAREKLEQAKAPGK